MHKKEIIIVMGMHRSGTSALARLFVDLGYDPGDNLMPANQDNPKGYWEDLDIYKLNNEILNSLFHTWDKTEDTKVRKINFLLNITLDLYANKAKDILTRKLQKSNAIVIKDPRFCILLPFWNNIFEKVNAQKHYFLIVRNPFDVAKSLNKRNGIQEKDSFDLWQYYYLVCLQDLVSDVFIQHYENLISDPSKQINQILKYLNYSQEQVIEQVDHYIKKSLDPQLQHFKTGFGSAEHQDTVLVRSLKLYQKLHGYKYKFNLNEVKELFNDKISVADGNKIKPNQKLVSGLSYRYSGNNKSKQIKHIKHGTGRLKLSFKTNSKHQYDEFDLYLCDKPCIAKIDSVRLQLENEQVLITAIKGNQLSCLNNLYIFNSNIPHLNFSTEQPLKILSVEIELYLTTEHDIVAGFAIPVLNDLINKNKLEITSKQQKLETLGEKLLQLSSRLEYDKDKYNSVIESVEKEKNTCQIELKKVIQKKSAAEEAVRLLRKNLKAATKDISLLKKETKQQHARILELSGNNITIKENNKYLEKQLKNEKLARDKVENKLELKTNELVDIGEELKEEQAKSKYLWDLKQKHETEIIELKKKIKKMKRSLSWQLSLPVRIISKYILVIPGPLVFLLRDFGYGIKLLRREGLKNFINRLLWYFRGKRLPEDIYLAKNKKSIKLLNSQKIDTSEPIEFPEVDDPLVSIIIPVHNQWKYTYRCLKSIRENTDNVSCEILLADDASDDETVSITKIIKNIKHLRNNRSLQFLKNCNKAAKEAKGKYIHFLNNDVVVQSGWLSSLIHIMERDEKAGIIGSKLVYPDGRLQEAGGIIWNDASGWNYGRYDDPEKPEYNYLKEVDYVSGASLMIRKNLWEKMEGFDELFAPAYYEDTDLAFRARELGYKVIYQPLSVITHYEGVSHGKDESEGIKKYQAKNRDKFIKRYDKLLNNDHQKNGVHVFTARERSKDKKHILVIDHYVPHHDKDAGSRSTFSYLKLMVETGFNVKFIGDNFYRHEPYTTDVQQLGIEVLYGNNYQSHIHDWIRENGEYFDYVFAHRMHIAPKYFQSLKLHTSAKIIYIGHDLQFLSSNRKYAITRDKNHKKDSEKFKQVETYIFNTVDMILPFSTYEAPYIKEIVPHKIVEPVPVYFYDNCFEAKLDFDRRRDILFVGGFGHPPNVDALEWMVNEIFPIVLKSLHDVRLIVVGSNPTDQIKAMASDSIEIAGYVTDEKLKEYYKSCRVAVIPLRYGAGVKGKLLEALYYGLPTVITSIAAEGVPEIENYSLIADRPDEFAKHIQQLYRDEKSWMKYAKASREFIEKNYSKKVVKELLEKLLV